MKIDTLQTDYVPGVCNIGPVERSMRLRAGLAGLALSLALGAVFVAVHAPTLLRLVVFLPTLLAAIGIIQSAFRFCVRFGYEGVFNFGPKLGETKRVLDTEAQKKDRTKVAQILILSVVAAGIFTTIVALIP